MRDSSGLVKFLFGCDIICPPKADRFVADKVALTRTTVRLFGGVGTITFRVTSEESGLVNRFV